LKRFARCVRVYINDGLGKEKGEKGGGKEERTSPKSCSPFSPFLARTPSQSKINQKGKKKKSECGIAHCSCGSVGNPKLTIPKGEKKRGGCGDYAALIGIGSSWLSWEKEEKI